jgi:hypothetical protein
MLWMMVAAALPFFCLFIALLAFNASAASIGPSPIKMHFQAKKHAKAKNGYLKPLLLLLLQIFFG